MQPRAEMLYLGKGQARRLEFIIESSVRSEYKVRINVIKVNQNLDQCCGHLGRQFATTKSKITIRSSYVAVEECLKPQAKSELDWLNSQRE